MSYLNRALTNFRNAVNARWPNRDKGSDGWIGDRAHQRRRSDHNPDPDGSVDAWDMDVDGVSVWQCIRAFEAHESSSYWIFNDQIALRRNGWRRQNYADFAGPQRNRHTKHVHFNTRASHENSNAPWIFPVAQEDDDMAKVNQVDWEAAIWRIEALVNGRETVANGPTKGEPVMIVQALNRIEKALAAKASG